MSISYTDQVSNLKTWTSHVRGHLVLPLALSSNIIGRHPYHSDCMISLLLPLDCVSHNFAATWHLGADRAFKLISGILLCDYLRIVLLIYSLHA